MLRLGILTIVVFIASVSLAHAVLFDRDHTETFAATTIVEHPLNKQWEAFKNRFNKVYRNGQHELQRRLIWETNWMKIRLHNAEYERGLHTFHLAMNHLGDLTAAEVKSAMNGFRMDMVRARAAHANRKTFTTSAAQLENLPSSVDWRNVSNVVTNVKNQGMCGSCWAFSATGSLEGQHALKNNGSLVSLSEQNLVDCSKPEGNEGCDGGLMDQAFEYVRKNGGIDSETAYPYRGIWSFGKCKFKTDKIGATVQNFTDIPAGNETALTAAVANVGPISVAIDASDFTFQFYFGGVYHSSSCSSTELDHGVLVVGYGSEGPNKDYYIVKNSWGRFWGKKGYILMSRNRGNNCGIASQASYPDV